jgi:hypothetical protein
MHKYLLKIPKTMMAANPKSAIQILFSRKNIHTEKKIESNIDIHPAIRFPMDRGKRSCLLPQGHL